MFDAHTFHYDLHALIHDAITQAAQETDFIFFKTFCVPGYAFALHVRTEVCYLFISTWIHFESTHDSFDRIEIFRRCCGIQQYLGKLIGVIRDDVISSAIGQAIVLVQLVAHTLGHAVDHDIAQCAFVSTGRITG